MFEDRIVVGLIEDITLLDENLAELKTLKARIDSGATVGSIDQKYVDKYNPPVIGKKLVKSSHGTTRRTLVKLTLKLKGKIVSGTFSVIDRSHMTYPILIGQDILIQDYVIDPKIGYKYKKKKEE